MKFKFYRAAEELNYAQSTLTMQMQKLEADLGVQLIERGKQITLTEAGSIRVGITDPTASYRLPQLLKQFMALFPKIEVSVDIASTPVLSERLLRGELDFALCSAPEFGKELYFEPLITEEFVLLLPEQHPLAIQQVVTLEELRGHRLLITAPNCPYRKKLESVLQESGGAGHSYELRHSLPNRRLSDYPLKQASLMLHQYLRQELMKQPLA